MELPTQAQGRPSVATLSGGGRMVVWESQSNIVGRRFDASGAPVGAEFQVNTYTTGFPDQPRVAALTGGGFVVVWHGDGSLGSDSHYRSIQARRFDSDALPVGDQFQVNAYTTRGQSFPDVTAASTGGFLVSWNSDGATGSDSSGYSVQARLFDPAGSAVGGDFQVNTYTTGHQRFPRLAVDAGGGFIVVWKNGVVRVNARRYDALATPLGADFQVNDPVSSDQSDPTVATNQAGDFLVAWSSNTSPGSDSSYSSIQCRRFDAAGAAVGDQFQVNAYTTGRQVEPALAFDDSGGFIVFWSSEGSPGTDSDRTSIQGRRFDTAGASIGSQFQVNTYTSDLASDPVVGLGPDGEFTVVWSERRGKGASVRGQYQRFSTVALCGESPEPDASCALADPSGAGKSVVSLSDSASNGKDRFSWRWHRGSVTDTSDFAEPTAGDAIYRLCLYDGSANPQPLFEMDIPTGVGWTSSGSGSSAGFKYKTKTVASLGGTTRATLKAGNAGKAKIQLKGRGPHLGPPATDLLVADVVVQLLIDDGAQVRCFKTAFPGSSGLGSVQKQDERRFKAKGP